MLYQLPNGKVISMSVEEYLDLTDADLQYLNALNAGDESFSPWQNSVIKKKKSKTEEEIDMSIDYQPEDDELSANKQRSQETNIDNLLDLSDSEPTD